MLTLESLQAGFENAARTLGAMSQQPDFMLISKPDHDAISAMPGGPTMANYMTLLMERHGIKE